MNESEASAAYPVGPVERQPQPPYYAKGQPDLGGAIGAQLWLRPGLLRPAWVALCGALASGSLELSLEPLLRLALLGFLVDVVWGGLWSAMAETDWSTPLRRWRDWDQGQPTRVLPYATSDSPAGRLARGWGQLRSWWTESLRPTLGPVLAGMALLFPLALVISGTLGARVLLVTLMALALLQFLFIWSGGDARPVPGAQALFEIALPWLAGHALFELPTLPSTLLALSYAWAHTGGVRLAHGWTGLGRWNLGQLAAVAVLLVWRQPGAAGIVGLLCVGQTLPQPTLFELENLERDFLRFGRPWLMAAMLIAAWGVRAAGPGG